MSIDPIEAFLAVLAINGMLLLAFFGGLIIGSK